MNDSRWVVTALLAIAGMLAGLTVWIALQLPGNVRLADGQQPAQREEPQPIKEFRLAGDVQMDGSSTVYPISEAAAVSHMKMQPEVKITVAVSGTGGGFKRFSAGETDICNASRPIKAAELRRCRANGIEFIELPVAYDGVSLVVNPRNDWAKQMSIDDLKKIFLAPGAKTWKEVHDDWPDRRIKIYAPGTDSGTFDYFYEALNRDRQGKPRFDSVSYSEDDNILVDAVSRNKDAIAFFSCVYYFEHRDRLKAVKIAVDEKMTNAVAPSKQTIDDGSYPLARPLFIYVNKDSLNDPACANFVAYYVDSAHKHAAKVGYVPLNMNLTARVRKRWEMEITGSVFLTDEGESRTGTLAELYGEK